MQSRVRGTIEAVAIKNLQELLRKKGITAEALFTKYDLDGNGSIDHSEFKAALESITGQQAPDAILSAIFSAVDTNTDGTLNLEEILTLFEGGPTEELAEGSSILIRDHPNGQYNGVYESQPDKINGKTWYMNPTGTRLYFYNANSGGASSWSLDDREQDGSNDWYRGGWARPRSDNSLPTGVRRWVGVGKISVTPSASQSSTSETERPSGLEAWTEPMASQEEDTEDDRYTLARDQLTWEGHHEKARSLGMHLASITSNEENEQVRAISGGETVWIGAIRHGSGNGPDPEHWHWSDGRQWSFTNWADGEPNNYGGSENRVQFYSNGLWNDIGEVARLPAVYDSNQPSPEELMRVEIISAIPGSEIQFRLINPHALTDEAWMGVYPKGARNEDHLNNWRWLRDIDPTNAALPAQAEGEYSIRVFYDTGYSLAFESEVVNIEPPRYRAGSDGNDFDNFSDGIQSTIASLEDDVMEGRITVEQAREIADAEVEKQIDQLPFMLKSPASSLWKANADRMQIELTSQLAEKSGTIAAGATIAAAAAGTVVASNRSPMMAEAPPPPPLPPESFSDQQSVSEGESESEYSSHDDWHEEYQVDVPDRVEVETEIEIPDQVEVDTDVVVPEYEDPDDWYRTTKVNASARVSVPDRVTVGSRRSQSFSSPSVSSEAAVQETPSSKQTVDTSSTVSSMSEVATAFAEARMLSDQRKLADSLKGKNFDFEIKVTSDPERTFGIGIEDAYRGGVTVLGEVSGVGEVEVRLPSGADSGSMSKGTRTSMSAGFSGWNGIRNRLIVSAQ